MTCLIDRVLGGQVRSHILLCWGSFLYIPWHYLPMYASFQEKIFAEISGKKFQIFHCSNVTTMKRLELREDFFLKIGIYNAKAYTKNVPNNPTQKYVTSSLPRSELLSISSKSLQCFTNRVVKLLQPCVSILLMPILHKCKSKNTSMIIFMLWPKFDYFRRFICLAVFSELRLNENNSTAI